MKKYSKLLSYVLRHVPEELGLTLDANGWTPVSELVTAVSARFPEFTIETLEDVVATNEKKRFEFDTTGTMIRACQGHSVSVNLGLRVTVPPEVLFHGTARQNVASIYQTGINAGNRHAVHLSDDRETAINVGSRRGAPVVITIRAKEMHDAGYVFTRSTNGVWLVDEVPPKYIIQKVSP